MESLRDRVNADIFRIFYDVATVGKEAVYRRGGGAGVPIVYVPQAQNAAAQDPRPPGDGKTIRVRVSEVAEPDRSDVVEIAGTEWFVERVAGGGPDDGEWIIDLTRSERRSFR